MKHRETLRMCRSEKISLFLFSFSLVYRTKYEITTGFFSIIILIFSFHFPLFFYFQQNWQSSNTRHTQCAYKYQTKNHTESMRILQILARVKDNSTFLIVNPAFPFPTFFSSLYNDLRGSCSRSCKKILTTENFGSLPCFFVNNKLLTNKENL